MSARQRIYLDNAATSWPKPEAVYAAVDHYQRHLGAPAGRSGYAEAAQVSQAVEGTRQDLAQFLSARSAEHLIFTANGTDALNLAIHGLLREGDHVITTVAEHNSVLRPLRNAESGGSITVTRIGCNSSGVIDPDDIRRTITARTRLIALVHASNVTGAIQPAAEVGQIARAKEVIFLVDAAQSLGHIPIAVDQLGVDLLAAPGHKGLLGPLGTGLLYVRPGVESLLKSVRQGGTGTQSEHDVQPDSLPGKYESGNLNVPGIVGLRAALGYLAARGMADICRHTQELMSRLIVGLSEIPGVKVHGPRRPEEQVGLVSISLQKYDPQEAAALLDVAYGIQARAGLHCAPLMHAALSTLEGGGTLRLSVGPFTTMPQIEVAIAAIAEISAAGVAI